jgi:hypothetical protein
MKKKMIILPIVLIVVFVLSIQKNYAQSETKAEMQKHKTVVQWDGRDTKKAGAFMRPDAVTLLKTADTDYEAGGTVNPDGSISTYLRIIEPADNTEITGMTNITEQENSVNVYPSTFSTSTTFYIQNVNALPVNLTIYDISGKKVRYIENIQTSTLKFNRDNLSTGTYLYKISAHNNFIKTGKIIIINQ